MMRRTKYILPDYDDTAPSHTYMNEMDVRDSISDYTSDYKIDGSDGNFESGGSHAHGTSGKRVVIQSKWDIIYLVLFSFV